MWSVQYSIDLAREYVGCMGERWGHLSAVGRVVQELLADADAGAEDVVCAAWLHDIGYSPRLAVTGFHPLDGATFLQSAGAPSGVVALVGHHTGAAYEAQERGLVDEWRALPLPDADGLNILTMVDLALGPGGEPQLDVDRIAGILSRYGDDSPVHKAVVSCRDSLLTSSAKAKGLLGLSDDWPLVVGQGVRDAESHRGVQL